MNEQTRWRFDYQYFKRIRENRKLTKRSGYDPTLFPVTIPSALEDALLAELVIPSVLVSTFNQNSILRLGQLNGMTTEHFLAWRGFGQSRLSALCYLLTSVRDGTILKKQSTEHNWLSKAQFLAFKIRSTKRIRENRRPLERSLYDPTLFPISIPATLEDVVIFHLAMSSILVTKLKQHSILRLGQLNGMTEKEFLQWEGFGRSSLQALCYLLISISDGAISKKEVVNYGWLSKAQLAPEVLSFPFTKLNLPTLSRTRLIERFNIETVANFIDAFESGSMYIPYLLRAKKLEQVWEQIAILARVGVEKYLSEVSLDSLSFLQIVQIIREQLPSNKQLIFDHRLCPQNVEQATLQAIGKQLDLTRERIRQLENSLIEGLQNGALREYGRFIRRKTLELFKPTVYQLSFHELLSDQFFTGVSPRDSSMPAPLVFLDRVFYSTFTVGEDTISLNKQTSTI